MRLEEHQVYIQNMMNSKYLHYFKERVVKWETHLATIADVNQIMIEIQRSWSYLEPLFLGSEEVRKELPEAATRFETINEDVIKSLASIHEIKICDDACNKEGLYPLLEDVQKRLEQCEKALDDYLEAKRNICSMLEELP